MKLKRMISSIAASGLLIAMLGSQAFAYNWSGYLGDNQWTSVAGLIKKQSDGNPWARWSDSENRNKGCKVEVYNSGNTRVSYGTLIYGSTKTLTSGTVNGKSYSMKAKTTSDTEVGIYNKGTWAP